jgi:hypothetical protein
MSDRIFVDSRSLEVSGSGRSVDLYVLDRGEVMITVKEEAGWDSQHASFTMTPGEATAIVKFLIDRGF